MATKNTKIFDLNLFSGSSELIRQFFRATYYDSGDGSVEFVSSEEAPPHPIESIIETNFQNSNELNDFTTPTVTYINRIQSFPLTAEDDFASDEEWKRFMVGGEFGSKSYPGIYNERVYADHYNTSSLPYTPKEIINIPKDVIEPSLSLTTEYYNFYSRYQQKTNNVDSELQIPNYYIFEPLETLLAPSEDTGSTQSRYSYENLKTLITDTYVNEDTVLDTSLKNIFFLDNLSIYNDSRMDTGDLNGHFDGDLNYQYSLLPFGNKLFIDSDLSSTATQFRDVLETSNYKLKFLKLLKEVFQNESQLSPSATNFAVNIKDALVSTGVLTGSVETTSTVPIRLIDVPTMLIYSYLNPASETNDITVANSGSYASQMDYVFDATGLYRYENTSASLGVFNDFMEVIKNNFQPEGSVGENVYPLRDFLQQANNDKYHETVAFRIEKIGGPPTVDARTQNTLQNVWFYNTNDAITYLDTQVKYDTEYTYKIYKYDIVQGYKYGLSDIAVTRQIATEGEGSEKIYCLEFYDPFTGLATPQLFSDENLLSLYEESGSLSTQIQEDITLINDELDSIGNLYRITKSSLSTELQETFEEFFSGNSESLNPIGTLAVPRPYGVLNRLANGTYYLSGYNFVPIRNESVRIPVPYSTQEVDVDPDSPIIDYDYLYAEISIYISSAHSGDLSSRLATDVIIGRTEEDSTSPSRGAGASSTFTGRMSSFAPAFTGTTPSTSAGMPEIVDETTTSGTGTADLSLEQQAAEFMQALLAQIVPRIKQIQVKINDLTQNSIRLLEIGDAVNSLASAAQINTSYPYLADFKTRIEPSVKIVEIPLEQKQMRIVDHAPNNFIVTPHHLLDQSNRIAFYLKYDTFSRYDVTYPSTITTEDNRNKLSYLNGHDFLDTSEQTQESVSLPRFIEVYRTTTKPINYQSFNGNLRKTIDLRQSNGDIPTDHLFAERVRENTKYYYAFRALNENRVAGQLSPVFESELINDGGYVYGAFQQYSEDELSAPAPQEPLMSIKKLINIVPNIQHLQLDTTTANFTSSSISQLGAVEIGTQADDTLWDAEKYFKIRLTSKKTSKKIDLNIVFKKEERK